MDGWIDEWTDGRMDGLLSSPAVPQSSLLDLMPSGIPGIPKKKKNVVVVGNGPGSGEGRQAESECGGIPRCRRSTDRFTNRRTECHRHRLFGGGGVFRTIFRSSTCCTFVGWVVRFDYGELLLFSLFTFFSCGCGVSERVGVVGWRVWLFEPLLLLFMLMLLFTRSLCCC
ncbi:unnamed protein product [Laminaria digitata]